MKALELLETIYTVKLRDSEAQMSENRTVPLTNE